VYLLTDETYRREFRNEIVHELRQAFAVRCAFRQGLDGAGSAPAATSGPPGIT